LAPNYSYQHLSVTSSQNRFRLSFIQGL